jgi:outer membrane lipoprotein carrier protein
MKYFATGLALLFSSSLFAATGPQQMDRFLQELDSLESAFDQKVYTPDQKQPIRSRGTFYLKRPRKFRWDYSVPKQLIVADGSQIWLYDPELEQVSVQSQSSALEGTPAMLLISGEPVSKAFRVSDGGSSEGMAWVELIPRNPESQFIRIRLAFSDDLLRRMQMEDKFGQRTRFRFTEIRVNPDLADDLFYFERPDDVDVFNQ